MPPDVLRVWPSPAPLGSDQEAGRGSGPRWSRLHRTVDARSRSSRSRSSLSGTISTRRTGWSRPGSRRRSARCGIGRRPNPDQRREIEASLADCLPRLERQQPGVVTAYHYRDEVAGDSTTLIVWRDEASRLAYREGRLIGEATAMERRLGLTSTRSAFALTYP